MNAVGIWDDDNEDDCFVCRSCGMTLDAIAEDPVTPGICSDCADEEG